MARRSMIPYEMDRLTAVMSSGGAILHVVGCLLEFEEFEEFMTCDQANKDGGLNT